MKFQVKEFAEEEGKLLLIYIWNFHVLSHLLLIYICKLHWKGPGSPFATLSGNLTRLLSTILLTTTACSIYSTALFVTTMTEIFPRASLGFITALLTVVTLFFGELLPKALAVANSELVTRALVPTISRFASLLRYKVLLIYIWNFHVLNHFLLIYIYKTPLESGKSFDFFHHIFIEHCIVFVRNA